VSGSRRYQSVPRHERYSALRRVVALASVWGSSVGLLFAVCFALTAPLPRTVAASTAQVERVLTELPAFGSRNFVMARSVSPVFDLPLAESVMTAVRTVELRVHSGDTLIALLSSVGASLADARAAARALENVFHPRKIKPGWTLQVTLHPQDPDGSVALQSLAFRPSAERDIEVVRTEDQGFLAHTIQRPLARETTLSKGIIDSSLFGAGEAAGIPDALLAQAIHALSFEVDFQRDIQAGDAFEFMYDSYRDESGELAKVGSLQYAEIVLSGKHLQYYGFTPKSGVTDLFSANGHSIRRSLLRTPVDATRISSRYGMRKHPILGYTTMHRGIDFAVPLGTPIQAAGDGVVVRAGRFGTYGNYVRIRHNSTYSTAYAHLRSFGRGIKSRAHVKQGDIIGYVGATGRATGPHLHYEVLQNDRQVNPRGIRLPAGEQLSGDDLAAFRQRQREIDALRETAAGQLRASNTLPRDASAPTA
jgi:murein DD-endopeptidase MepM/ murein hydrolase activator NlpD